MPLTPHPTFPEIGDANFNQLAYDWATFMAGTGQDELDALVTAVDADKDAAAESAITATAQVVLATAQAVTAHNEATAAASAALVLGVLPWVSGTTYAIDDVRYSPIDNLSYRRRTTGGGTTDPSLDGTNWAVTTPSPVPNMTVVTATGTWTCPANVYKAKVTVVGGGGSAGNGVSQTGGGGGGGGTAIKTLAVTPGVVYTCTIGAGGVGLGSGVGNTVGNAGGTSSFAGSGITTVSATGGAGGAANQTGGAGGVGSNGDLNLYGGTGHASTLNLNQGPPALGGSSFLAGNTPQATAGNGYGAGSGGRWNDIGSPAGAPGVIVIEY